MAVAAPHSRRYGLSTAGIMTMMIPRLSLALNVGYLLLLRNDGGRSILTKRFWRSLHNLIPPPQLLAWYSIPTGVGIPKSAPPSSIVFAISLIRPRLV